MPKERDVTLEVLSETRETGAFEISEIFAQREREGFLILSHQGNFWQPGDEYEAGSLSVKVVFDESQIVKPLVFWQNSSRVFGENGNGYFLATPMNISIDTSVLSLGQHTMVVQVTDPHGRVFEHAWIFVIQEREPPRARASDVLVPTIDYLLEHPLPTPPFFFQNSAGVRQLDRFSPIGTGEGVCFFVWGGTLLAPNPTEIPGDFFRHSIWKDIRISVDEQVYSEDQFGLSYPEAIGGAFICFNTDSLAQGVHLAELDFTLEGKTYSHKWAFVIE